MSKARIRLLLYAHDGTGIGHIVRTCTLARALKQREPEAEVYVVSGSPVTDQFLATGGRCLRLPPQVRVEQGGAEPELVRRKRKQLAQKRSAIIFDFVKEYAPDLCLIDHLPLGKKNELEASLEILAQQKSILLLGYRRIVEDEESTRALFCYSRYRDALTSYFQAVLVYAPPWIEEQFGLLKDIPIPQHYTGFVCRKEATSRERAREHFQLSAKEKVITCGLGGGRYTWPLARQIVAAWKARRPVRGHLLFFLGPFFSADADTWVQWTEQPDLTIIQHSSQFPLGVAAADAVISTAGYNSMLEVLYQRRLLWVIPHQRKECEQKNSAQFLEDFGALRCVGQGGHLSEQLPEIFSSLLARDNNLSPLRAVPSAWFEGAENTARLVLALAQEAMDKRNGQ